MTTKRKPGADTVTNSIIVAMRQKGKPIKVIAKELAETEWYVRTVIKLQMSEDDRKDASVLCKQLASQVGVATAKRRKLLREKIGDVETHEYTSEQFRVPIPKSLGVYINQDLLYLVKEHAAVDGAKLSEVLFPIVQEHLALASKGIETSLRGLLAGKTI